MSDCCCSVSVILLHSWILFIVRDSFFLAIQLKFSLTWLPPITPNYRLIKPLDYWEPFSSLPSPTSSSLQRFPEPSTRLYWINSDPNPQVYPMELRFRVLGCIFKGCSLTVIHTLYSQFEKVSYKGWLSWRLLGTKWKAQIWNVVGNCRPHFSEREYSSELVNPVIQSQPSLSMCTGCKDHCLTSPRKPCFF